MIRNWLYGGAVAVALTAACGTPMIRAQEVDSISPRPRPVDLAFSEPEVARFGEADLDELVAPVALYPDALLTQVFVAATYPLDVVKAERFVTAIHGDVGQGPHRGGRAGAMGSERANPGWRFSGGHTDDGGGSSTGPSSSATP